MFNRAERHECISLLHCISSIFTTHLTLQIITVIIRIIIICTMLLRIFSSWDNRKKKNTYAHNAQREKINLGGYFTNSWGSSEDCQMLVWESNLIAIWPVRTVWMDGPIKGREGGREGDSVMTHLWTQPEVFIIHNEWRKKEIECGKKSSNQCVVQNQLRYSMSRILWRISGKLSMRGSNS